MDPREEINSINYFDNLQESELDLTQKYKLNNETYEIVEDNDDIETFYKPSSWEKYAVVKQVKKEEKKEEEKEIELNGTKEDPCKNLKNSNGEEYTSYHKIPTSTFNKLIEFIMTIDENTSEDDDNPDWLKDPESVLSVALSSSSYKSLSPDGIFEDRINKELDRFINDIKYGNTNLTPGPLKVKKNKKKNSAVIQNIFSSQLGIGRTIQVPLWHSGFWLTMKPPKNDDLINLEYLLAEEEVYLGRETSKFIYSNYSVIYNRIITEFILDHVINTTLALQPDDDILDYIDMRDFYSIVLGVIISMYPNGYKIVKNCKNGAVYNKDVDDSSKDSIACTNRIEGTIDFSKLLWVDRSYIPDKALNIMANRTPGSVSKNEVNEYKRLISFSEYSEFKTTSAEGREIIFKLKNPTLKENIKKGEDWVQSLIKQMEANFGKDISDGERERRIEDLVASKNMSIYNTYIDSISLEDDEGELSVANDQDDITDVLDLISSDRSLLNDYFDNVFKYINDSTIAIIALPNYTCKECGEEQSTKEKSDKFSEFIPFDIVNDFFALSTFRLMTLRATSR